MVDLRGTAPHYVKLSRPVRNGGRSVRLCDLPVLKARCDLRYQDITRLEWRESTCELLDPSDPFGIY